MQEKEDSDGFTKIKYKTRQSTPGSRPKKNRKAKSGVLTTNEVLSEEAKLEELAKLMESRRKTLEESDWFKKWQESLDQFEASNQRPKNLPSRILCLGLGSIETSRIAQFQLVLLLLLIERYKVKVTETYDPMTTTLDRAYLESISITVMSENTHAMHPIEQDDSPTYFLYLPHFPRSLYQNILQSNWSTARLPRCVFVANEFSGYLLREPKRKLEAEVPCIPLIVPHLEIINLPSGFEKDDVFNDMAIQWVPQEIVNTKMKEALDSVPQPVVDAVDGDVV